MRKPGRDGRLFYPWSILPFNACLKLIAQEADTAKRSTESRDRGQAWAGYGQIDQKSKGAAADRLDARNKVEARPFSGSTHIAAVAVSPKIWNAHQCS